MDNRTDQRVRSISPQARRAVKYDTVMADRSDAAHGHGRQTVRPALESAFAASCLPSTMQLARRCHLEVETRVALIHPEWPFEDRVLLWLLPNMELESVAFHSENGGNIESLFAQHQLDHFDQVLTEELGRRLAQAAPDGLPATDY
jgi:hypothetical protein